MKSFLDHEVYFNELENDSADSTLVGYYGRIGGGCPCATFTDPEFRSFFEATGKNCNLNFWSWYKDGVFTFDEAVASAMTGNPTCIYDPHLGRFVKCDQDDLEWSHHGDSIRLQRKTLSA